MSPALATHRLALAPVVITPILETLLVLRPLVKSSQPVYSSWIAALTTCLPPQMAQLLALSVQLARIVNRLPAAHLTAQAKNRPPRVIQPVKLSILA